ncbi:NAD(P)-binding protein [Coemansia reversa NRRL 1564]|uniref:NAD(P)-binding protein n=1 Tax=Coemansia reversa (strain ATCC 12441 / NRRL 1564) TaxID=763665 RepID=A0A2G5B583_COERN|nr:NAD(P)-binding protein [Coemansia reversa NRRL 1564]|eukprot:PIA14169.1 NAD(P)-binding protein [Coemansia reversa NRRL 1564]
MQIKDKVAVITGGARGFGKRMAEMVVERGGKVVLGDILEGTAVADELNRKSKTGKVAVFQLCDVTKSADIQALVSRAISEFGRLDIMVNNAGIGGTLPWSESDDVNLSRTIDINLKAPIEGTRLAVRHFIENKRPGCVVNVSSMMAFFPAEFSPVYGATKSGIANFTACCATLAQMNPPIHVNAVAPNFANTVMVRDLIPKSNNVFHKSGMLTVDEVVVQMIRCIEDESLAGDTIKLLPGKSPLVHKGRKAVVSGMLAGAKL